MTFFARRDATLCGAVAGVHLVASISLLVFVFGSGMARFDSSDPGGLAERIAPAAIKRGAADR